MGEAGPSADGRGVGQDPVPPPPPPPSMATPPPPPPGMAPPPPPTFAPEPVYQAQPVGAPAALQPLGVPARSAQIVMGAASVAMAFGGWTTWHRRSVLVGVRNGDVLSAQRADEIDTLVQTGALVQLAALVVGAIFFIIWFHRAYRNLAAMGRAKHRSGWAIGGWLVPFLNLVRPYQIAREIAVDGSAPGYDRQPPVVGLWWALWVLRNLGSRFMFRADTDTIDGLITADTWSTVSDVALVAAGVAAIFMISTVNSAQQRRLARLSSH